MSKKKKKVKGKQKDSKRTKWFSFTKKHIGFIGACLGLLGVLLTIFVQPYFDSQYNHSKQMSIEGNVIRNVNKNWGVPESEGFQPKYCSNFIFNEVTVFQERKTPQAITKIELFDIKKIEYPLADVQYDGGFYSEDQRFLLLAYNNGNTKGFSEETTLRLTLINDQYKDKESYVEYKVLQTSLDSGEVKSLLIKSFDDIIEDFKKNSHYFGLKIECEVGDESLMMMLQFNRKTNTFDILRGGARGFPEFENKPLLDLTKDVSEQSVDCHIPLEEGSNKVDFTVLVDRTCHLEYKLAMLSGEKRFESTDSYKVTIRVPMYNQERGDLFGNFYLLFKKYPQILNKKFSYSMDEIRSLDDSLLYDKYKAAKEFYHFEEE